VAVVGSGYKGRLALFEGRDRRRTRTESIARHRGIDLDLWPTESPWLAEKNPGLTHCPRQPARRDPRQRILYRGGGLVAHAAHLMGVDPTLSLWWFAREKLLD